MMTCTITLNTVREIREQIENASTALEVGALDRWTTEGGFIDNEAARQSLNGGQKFRDYAWYQVGSARNGPKAMALKGYRPKSSDTFRHNPHV